MFVCYPQSFHCWYADDGSSFYFYFCCKRECKWCFLFIPRTAFHIHARFIRSTQRLVDCMLGSLFFIFRLDVKWCPCRCMRLYITRNEFIWYPHQPLNYFVLCCIVNYGYVTFVKSCPQRKWYVDDGEKFPDTVHLCEMIQNEKQEIKLM